MEMHRRASKSPRNRESATIARGPANVAAVSTGHGDRADALHLLWQNRRAATCMPSDVCFDDGQSKAVETSHLQPTSTRGGERTTRPSRTKRETHAVVGDDEAWRSRVATETRLGAAGSTGPSETRDGVG
jgi:hypothetical protein